MTAFLLFLFILCGFSAGDSPNECLFCIQKTCSPSLPGVPVEQFSASAETRKLHHAILSFRTDETPLVSILTSLSESQRQELVEDYTKDKGSMVGGLACDSSTTGYKKIIIAMVIPLVPFYAKELIQAIDNHDRPVIIEILASLPPCVIRQVASKYQELRGKGNLHDDLESVRERDTIRLSLSEFIQTIQSLSKGDRDESTEVNMDLAAEDARKLKAGGVDYIYGTDIETFITIFTKRSMTQLAETLRQYKELRLRKGEKKFVSLQHDIESEFPTPVSKLAFMTIARNALDQPLYFAQEIETLMNKRGWYSAEEEDKLIRIIRGRGDIDMEDIKKAYQREYRRSLADKIGRSFFRKTDFSRTLLSIVNGSHKL